MNRKSAKGGGASSFCHVTKCSTMTTCKNKTRKQQKRACSERPQFCSFVIGAHKIWTGDQLDFHIFNIHILYVFSFTFFYLAEYEFISKKNMVHAHHLHIDLNLTFSIPSSHLSFNSIFEMPISNYFPTQAVVANDNYNDDDVTESLRMMLILLPSHLQQLCSHPHFIASRFVGIHLHIQFAYTIIILTYFHQKKKEKNTNTSGSHFCPGEFFTYFLCERN